MRAESLEFLRQLLTTPSPSGSESAGQKIWCDYVQQFADEVVTDAYGNATGILNGGLNPKILIDGHIDEIGLMIKHIDEKLPFANLLIRNSDIIRDAFKRTCRQCSL